MSEALFDALPEGLTYNEWASRGYQVLKGEKATGRNARGEATFIEDQVQECSYEDYGELDFNPHW